MDMSIGELAGLTGVPVKTIRYYSDLGLVPEARRTEAGYRRYDDSSLARLELVRALRDLGLDIDTTRRIASRPMTIAEVAAAQANAVDLHIHQLRLRRRVLRAIARGVTRPEEVSRMTAFARASADEVNRIMEDFLAAVFAGHEANPATAASRSDDAAYRSELASQLERFSDPRVERYWQLIGVINGWPPQPPMVPAYQWFIAALRAHAMPAGGAAR